MVGGAAAVFDVFAAGPGVAGAATAGRLACGGGNCGFGPKNLAHRMITPKESSEATRIRSSGVNLSFCPGTLMSLPQSSELFLQMNSLASLPISPEPGRIQICATAAGSPAAASFRARFRAPRQILQSHHTHSATPPAQNGNSPPTHLTARLFSSPAQTPHRGD